MPREEVWKDLVAMTQDPYIAESNRRQRIKDRIWLACEFLAIFGPIIGFALLAALSLT